MSSAQVVDTYEVEGYLTTSTGNVADADSSPAKAPYSIVGSGLMCSFLVYFLWLHFRPSYTPSRMAAYGNTPIKLACTPCKSKLLL